MDKNMKLIYEMMPAGWKETAKTEKALLRSRHISTPEELLRTYPQITPVSKFSKN